MKLELGTEVDFATGEQVAGLTAELSAGFSLLGKEMRKRDPRPLYYDIPQTVIAGLGGSPVVGAVRVKMGGPNSGRVWDIRQLVATAGDDRTQAIYQTVTGAAAAGGTLTLPNGAGLAGFTVTSATVAAAVSGAVTVTNVNPNGTLTYQWTMGPNGAPMTVTYPVPILPFGNVDALGLAESSTIVINIPAVVGGSAWAVTAQIVYPVSWYKTFSDNIGLGQLLVPGINVVPSSVVPASAESIFLHYGEQLQAIVYGPFGGQSVTCIARVADWPDTVPEGHRV